MRECRGEFIDDRAESKAREAQQASKEAFILSFYLNFDDYVSNVLALSVGYRDAVERMMGGGTEWEEFVDKMTTQLYADAKDVYIHKYK